MIEITGVDLRKFIADVYDLSSPQGMGFLHFKEGQLDEKTIDRIIDRGDKYELVMDYVHGRACKMNIFREGDKLFIDDKWFDHSDRQLQELLKRHNITVSQS